VLEDWEQEIGTLEVVPGKDGIFDVHLDGDLVFTKSMIGRYPDPDDVVPLLRERLS
jgi:selenoprotein W-related protein